MKSKKCIFLGYCDGSKRYRVIEKDTKKIISTRDVFVETSKKPETVVSEEQMPNVFIPLTDPNVKDQKDVSDSNENEPNSSLYQSTTDFIASTIAGAEEKELSNALPELLEPVRPGVSPGSQV